MRVLRYPRVANYCLLIALTTLFFSSVIRAEAPFIFVEPPAPEVLARILYTPRYRSVDGEQVVRPDTFGMMINFKFDSTEIVADSLPMLDSVGEMLTLESTRRQALIIEGHTDAQGTEIYNESLSKRRAAAIKQYLVASFDIDPKRLLTVGQGESRLYDGGNPLNPLNRRAEFKPLKNIIIQ